MSGKNSSDGQPITVSSAEMRGRGPCGTFMMCVPGIGEIEVSPEGKVLKKYADGRIERLSDQLHLRDMVRLHLNACQPNPPAGPELGVFSVSGGWPGRSGPGLPIPHPGAVRFHPSAGDPWVMDHENFARIGPSYLEELGGVIESWPAP